MTEEEWLASKEPDVMLRALNGVASDRKTRLFSVACCRRLRGLPWSLDYVPCPRYPVDRVADERAIAAVLLAERYADESATDAELDEANSIMSWECYEHQQHPVYHACFETTVRPAAAGSLICYHFAALATLPWDEENDYEEHNRVSYDRLRSELCHHANQLRDIFGNPFRPVAFDPAWRTSDVMLLARGIYDERAFDRMPILADALQDAGCDSDDTLNHCRDTTTPHARGCWVVDLVLGKS